MQKHYSSIFTSRDANILNEWKQVVFPISSLTSSDNKIKIDMASIIWQVPQTNFVKINFDGSSRGNIGIFVGNILHVPGYLRSHVQIVIHWPIGG